MSSAAAGGPLSGIETPPVVRPPTGAAPRSSSADGRLAGAVAANAWTGRSLLTGVGVAAPLTPHLPAETKPLKLASSAIMTTRVNWSSCIVLEQKKVAVGLLSGKLGNGE
ncbi:unnamed protein product [Phytophthora lilii]|uniref:Unnamed protein product n=1 Tax=Phytophthora lilii TaxID=2077276 RepID=A0A9W6WPW1_9STRA|nr:unnamed protein product [Phytophthora lilii]